MNNWHSTKFKVYRLFLLLALVVGSWTGSPLSAQVTTSSILGSITDTGGAVIPNAAVSVRDVDRNLTKKVNSNEQGAYRVDFLLPGNYAVSVSAENFKTSVQNGISLSAGVPATINMVLSPGAVTESVEVTSAAPIVETSNAEIGTTVAPKDFTELPLVNRNAYTLLDLTPGVQANTVVQSFGAPTQSTIINGGSTNGSGTTNYYFDGAPNINALNSNGGILPNQTSIMVASAITIWIPIAVIEGAAVAASDWHPWEMKLKRPMFCTSRFFLCVYSVGLGQEICCATASGRYVGVVVAFVS